LTPTMQALDERTAPALATSAPGRRLLKGAVEITEFILKRESERKDVRWFYGQLPNFAGVVWRLAEDSALLSWTDELTEYLETKAAEGKAAALAAAQAKAAQKQAVIKAAAKIAHPPSRRRPRARPRPRKASRVAAE
jgi:hypothetical protein